MYRHNLEPLPVFRIALFLPDLQAGGAERVMLTLSKGFAELGHEVDLVLARAQGELMVQVPEQVRVVNLTAGAPVLGMIGFGLSAVTRLSRYLRDSRPDVLLSTLTGANLAAVLAVRLSGIAVRLVLREASSLQNVKGASRLWLMRRLYPLADVCVVGTEALRRELSELLPSCTERIVPIYNPIDIDSVTTLAQQPVDDPWIGPGAAPLVLALGRLTLVKDFPTLLRSFALVRKSVNAHLLIFGEGPLRKQLEVCIADLGLEGQVRLPGFSINPFPFVRRARVLVSSSIWEGFPNVLLESLALGTQVVATDCRTGPAEILDCGKFGKLVPVGDAEALAQGILDVLSGDEIRVSMLLRRACEFSREQICHRYLEVLRA